jgi:hypothetical protein
MTRGAVALVVIVGVAIVGEVANTLAPLPVSSVSAAARFAEVGVARKAATPVARPETPVEIGSPVQFVRVPEVGVPRIGVTSVGEVSVLLVSVSVVALPTSVSVAAGSVRVPDAAADGWTVVMPDVDPAKDRLVSVVTLAPLPAPFRNTRAHAPGAMVTVLPLPWARITLNPPVVEFFTQ